MANRRVLRVVQADAVETVGDQDFDISEYLFGGLLAQVHNRQNRFVTGITVAGPDAAALADAIEQIEETQQWELARAMNGDPDGEGVRAFCVWLRRGGFEIIEERGNGSGKT